MVVLDGHNMMGTGPNQYLQPDYLSPLPTTLDAKKSPLALLAQTCSQIGADSPNTKNFPSMDSKRKSSTSSESSSVNAGSAADHVKERDSNSNPRPRSGNGGTPGSSNKSSSSSSSSASSGGGKVSPGFKPYEITTSNSKESSSNRKSPSSEFSSTEKPKTPSKRTASPHHHEHTTAKHPRKSPTSPSTTPGAEKKSEKKSSNSSDDGKSSPKSNNNNNNNEQGSSPIIRSGLEVLNGHGLNKDSYGKPSSSALSSLSALAAHYPPGFDPTNPAMRPPFFGPPTGHPFLGGGYPPAGLGGPPLSYTRVKTPSGDSIVPVCKDPYCTGCPLSMSGLNNAMVNAMAAAAGFPGFLNPSSNNSGGICPAGCAQCDHQKYSPLGFSPFMPPPPGFGFPPGSSYQNSFLSAHAAAANAAQQQQQQQQRPHVCSWTIGDSYCGKRFPSPEELLQHLRTHTNGAAPESLANLSSPSSMYTSSLSAQMSAAAAAAAAMQRTYPTPPLSPLSAARYNPYAAAAQLAAAGKPGSTFGLPPTSLSSLVPSHQQSLANYYSLYAGQRMGVHP